MSATDKITPIIEYEEPLSSRLRKEVELKARWISLTEFLNINDVVAQYVIKYSMLCENKVGYGTSLSPQGVNLPERGAGCETPVGAITLTS